jgi:hypothetical protein
MAARKNYKAVIDWRGYDENRAILPVCVRSPAMEGRKVAETLRALSERIEHVHVVICDSLDRWNYPNFSDPEEESLRRARKWLDEHKPTLDLFCPGHTLARWNDVRKHPSFEPRHEEMQRLYRDVPTVRRFVDGMVDYYLERKQSRYKASGMPFNEVLERQRSTAYMLEELPGDMTYGEMYRAPRVYWGLYTADPQFFNARGARIDMTFPLTCPVHINRLPPPVPAMAPRSDGTTEGVRYVA